MARCGDALHLAVRCAFVLGLALTVSGCADRTVRLLYTPPAPSASLTWSAASATAEASPTGRPWQRLSAFMHTTA